MKEQTYSNGFAIKMTAEEQTDLLLKRRDDDNNINVGEGGSSDPLRPHFIFILFNLCDLSCMN